MKFDLWTFCFQVINFVVLLLILKRLLYRPVREILEKRRERIRKSVEEAELTKREALELKERHSRELAELEVVKVGMLDRMREEVLEEKKRLLADAEREAEARLEKARVQLEAERGGFERVLEERARETVALFSSKLMMDIADRDLHLTLCRRLLGNIGSVCSEIAMARGNDEVVTMELLSALPLEEEEIEAFRSSLETGLSSRVEIVPSVDHSLIAGVKIRSRDLVFDASLSAQIASFTARLGEKS